MPKFIIGGGGNHEKKTTDVGGGGGGDGGGISYGNGMMDHMDLGALPEGCVANVVSLTTPRDACRLSLVSRSFRSASESDAVWDKFLPPEINTILSNSVPAHPVRGASSASITKKQLYLTLCDNPVLVEQGSMSLSLDKWSGKKCYMISARQLSIVWSDTPHYWKWISVPDSRFEEVAELVSVCWLEIRGRICTGLLSPCTLYKAYVVFKSSAGAYGFEHQPADCTVGLVGGGERAKQAVFLDAGRGQNLRYQMGMGPRRVGIFNRRHILGYQQFQPREVDEAQYPKERDDGWLEIELGEFFYEGGGGHGDGELEMACLETKGGHWKGGLIVQGIEIRPKK